MTIDNPEKPRKHSTQPRWTRSLPPLFIATAVIVVLALVLPNALRLPQQNPTPVLEYAPVPPDDNNNSNNNGNLGSLGLGSTSGLSEGSLPPILTGSGDTPPQKHCVGKPARQTEDPMSPPCVPFYTGDNGGATWRGVTKDEIRVVLYVDDGGYGPVGRDETTPPAGHAYDLDKTPQTPCPKKQRADPNSCAHLIFRLTRALSNYFNTRFQTYNRRVHFWIYVSNASKAEDRRKDAAAIRDEIDPFSVVDWAVFGGYNEEFLDALASRQVMVFSSSIASHTNEFYRLDSPFAWGFWPDVEHAAKLFSSYICTRIAPTTVQRSGDSAGANGSNGQRRVYGFYHTSDAGEKGLQLFYKLAKNELQSCGVTPAAYGTFPYARFTIDNKDSGSEQTQALANFRNNNVNTILWFGGVEGKLTPQMAAVHYYPEMLVAGDLAMDNNANGSFQDQTVWANARTESYQIRTDRLASDPGYKAAVEGDPNIDSDAASYGPELYRDFFMMFNGIQIAGPKLSPDKVNLGFHAIPERSSTDPYVAACFFDPGDYTCVKDAMEMWWDPSGKPPGATRNGCYRIRESGTRYLWDKWTPVNNAFNSERDPCNGNGGTFTLRPSPV